VAPRRPTDTEFAALASAFPALVRADVWITDGEVPTYNCIAYSLGHTDRWINPPQPLSAFQALYNGAPYSRPTAAPGAAAAGIDGWATPKNGPSVTAMTHGSRTSTSQPAPLWESKLGSSYRITHGRSQLTSNVYGRVVTSFS
jgi:hypothetical protein